MNFHCRFYLGLLTAIHISAFVPAFCCNLPAGRQGQQRRISTPTFLTVNRSGSRHAVVHQLCVYNRLLKNSILRLLIIKDSLLLQSKKELIWTQ